MNNKMNYFCKTLLSLVVLWILCFSINMAKAEDGWLPIGPPGGNVNDIVYSPTNDDSVFIATNSGVFISTNGGLQWSLVRGGLPYYGATAIAIDSNRPHIIFIGFGSQGVYRSLDGGNSWMSMNNGLTNPRISDLVIRPPAKLYAATSGGVFVMDTESLAWDSLGLGDQYIYTIVLDPQNDTTLYTGTRNGVFKSIDGGVTWDAMNNGITADHSGNRLIYSLAVDPQNPNIIYAGNEGFLDDSSIYRTVDGGINWQVLRSDFLSVYSLVIDPDNTKNIYAATYMEGVLKSTDGGNIWEPVNNFEELPQEYKPEARSLAINPFDPSIILLGTTKDGIFYTNNSCSTWTYASTGFSLSNCYCIAIDPYDHNRIFTAREMEIMRTADGGLIWKVIKHATTNSIVIDPIDSNVIFAGTSTPALGGNILKSSDGGTTWVSVRTYWSSEVHSIAIDPKNNQRIYAGLYGRIDYSNDGGLTWEEIKLEGIGVTTIVLDSSNIGVIYAGTTNGVLKSNDFGSTWQNVRLEGKFIFTLAINPINSRILFAGTAHDGVYKSYDGGLYWFSLPVPFGDINVRTIVLDKLNPDNIFIGTFGNGVFNSEDGGATWSELNTGLTSFKISALMQPQTAPYSIYAATHGSGVLKYVMEPTAVRERNQSTSKISPQAFHLAQNYPNPFNPLTTIRYDLSKSVNVNVSIYNLHGQRIKVLENGFQQAGSYAVQWDGKDNQELSLSSGIYICRIQAGEFGQSIKLMLLK